MLSCKPVGVVRLGKPCCGDREIFTKQGRCV